MADNGEWFVAVVNNAAAGGGNIWITERRPTAQPTTPGPTAAPAPARAVTKLQGAFKM